MGRVGLGLLLLGSLALGAQRAAPPEGEPVGEPVVVLRLSGAIQPASLRYLRRGLKEAERRNAAVTVLELDTPGGLLGSLREMTQALGSSDRPVVVYVTPQGARAASAGFFLLLAADVAAMAPGTNAGAAHPVPLGSREEVPQQVQEKLTNDAAAFARALAELRQRSAEAAELAVTESRSFTEQECLRQRLTDLVAADRAELLRALDGRSVRRADGRVEVLSLRAPQVQVVELDAAERVLMVIADPNVAYVLLLLGLLGLAVELFSPGAWVPGALGALSLLLSLWALSVLPVSLVGVAFLLGAVACFVAEAFVPSYGLLTVGGLVCLVLGSLLLVEGPLPSARVSAWVVLPTALLVSAVVGVLAARAFRVRRAPARAGLEALVGEEGEAVEALAPSGRVFVHGEYWDAVAPASPLPKGTRVRIRAIAGSRLQVDPAP